MATPRFAGIAAVLIAVVSFASAAADERAQARFEQGRQALQQGEFAQAQAAFADAVEAAPKNEQYQQYAATAQRAVQLQETLAEAEGDDWQQAAQSLFWICHRHGADAAALRLAEQLLERHPSIATKVLMARACLETDRDADARKVLQSVGNRDSTPEVRTLVAIAFAHQERTRIAATILTHIPHPREDARLAFDLARLLALVEQSELALDMLALAVKHGDAEHVAWVRRVVPTHADFASLREDTAWQAALAGERDITTGTPDQQPDPEPDSAP
jgi:thioredoxin-like negative regulator of GroEL